MAKSPVSSASKLDKLFQSDIGRIIVSILLGLGIAALFRRACKGKNCVVIQGPKREEIDKYYYKVFDDCFKYKPREVPCTEEFKA